MTGEPQIPKAFVLLADLCSAAGGGPATKFENCWEHQIDGRWWVALNAHREPRRCSKGDTIPPCTAVLEYNGWPAGMLDLGGGCLVRGAAANEETLIAALEAAIEKLRPV